MNIAFRVDASAQIGLGHLKRCAALAGALARLGAESTFVWRDIEFDCDPIIKASGASSICFGSDGVGGEDAERFVSEICDARPDWIVVDHYGLDRRWHDEVASRLGARIAVIDDLADRPLGAELVIDQNCHADHRTKYTGRLRDGARLLGGPGFALLGPDYADAPRYSFHADVQSIGVFMGGSDPANSSVTVLDAIDVAGFDGPVEVVSTAANPHLPALRIRCAARPETKLTIDLPSLAGFFARHDIQIGAGGSASWERFCIGAPSVLLGIAANHDQVLIPLADQGAASILASGWSAATLAGALSALIADAASRRKLTDAGPQIVDGQGARRVALAMLSRDLRLRRATKDDSQRAYDWRNAPAVRLSSRQSGLISLADHAAWFAQTLASSDRRLFVGEIAGDAVGFIRLDRIDDRRSEVSFYLDPALDGLGLGQALLAAVEGEIAAGGQIVGEVLPGNVKSARLFEKLGYYGVEPGRWEKQIGSAQQGVGADENR